MKYFLLNIFLFVSSNLFAQGDWKKWDKKEFDYRLKENSRNRDYSFDSDNPGEFVLKSFANGYWFFFSDVDGDNCPFRPSCSAYLLDAVQETNIFQGSLMFFDRFTRDLNLFKKGNYPKTKTGRYYDPVYLYTLSEDKIHFIPPSEIVTTE
ncbi:MAG TPA: membrane protein insertion efficiency factor YidD [Ignavibacteriaceae bacterium]|nr:membrane protein insertion efficiency factor YidD [Ignavibacteriaceae bacterium]